MSFEYYINSELSQEKYEKVKNYYWVCVFKRDRNFSKNKTVKFSYLKPDPVPNPEMHWVRPTWEELNEWDRKRFREICEESE